MKLFRIIKKNRRRMNRIFRTIGKENWNLAAFFSDENDAIFCMLSLMNIMTLEDLDGRTTANLISHGFSNRDIDSLMEKLSGLAVLEPFTGREEEIDDADLGLGGTIFGYEANFETI